MNKKIIVSSVTFLLLVDALFIYLALTITPVNLKRNRFLYEYGETVSTDPADYFNANDNVLLNVQLDLENGKVEDVMVDVEQPTKTREEKRIHL